MIDGMTIGEVAHRAGIQTSAIRYYESTGLMPPPLRVNGRRRYEERVFQRLGLIQLARKAGFRIGELQVLFSGFDENTPASERWKALTVEKIAEMDALIERTVAMRTWLSEALAQCRCVELDDCAPLMIEVAKSIPVFREN